MSEEICMPVTTEFIPLTAWGKTELAVKGGEEGRQRKLWGYIHLILRILAQVSVQ